MQYSEEGIFREIDEHSPTPKYLQVKNAIVNAFQQERINPYERVPSINQMSYTLDISRDTVERGYRYLKQLGILESVPGKGFYLKPPERHKDKRIFLLLDSLAEQNKLIYDALLERIGDDAIIDLFVYNNNPGLFKKLIQQRHSDYSFYVLIPIKECVNMINLLPKEKLIVVARLMKSVAGQYGAVCENLSENISSLIHAERSRILKYKSIRLILPDNFHEQRIIQDKFKSFATQHGLRFETLRNVNNIAIHNGDLFFEFDENALVPLIETIDSANLKIGEDVGVLSYQHKIYKDLLANGITTFSIDHSRMGDQIAELITTRIAKHIFLPFTIQRRNSF